MPSSSQTPASCPEQTPLLARNQSHQERGQYTAPRSRRLRVFPRITLSLQAIALQATRRELWHPGPPEPVAIFWHPATPSESQGRPGSSRLLPPALPPAGPGRPGAASPGRLLQGPDHFQVTGKTYLQGFPFPPSTDRNAAIKPYQCVAFGCFETMH